MKKQKVKAATVFGTSKIQHCNQEDCFQASKHPAHDGRLGPINGLFAETENPEAKVSFPTLDRLIKKRG